MIWRGTTGKALIAGVTVSAALVLLSVLMMRWNVVIGGQEISKTGQGLVHYHMQLFGREGLLASIAVVAAPLVCWRAWSGCCRPGQIRRHRRLTPLLAKAVERVSHTFPPASGEGLRSTRA